MVRRSSNNQMAISISTIEAEKTIRKEKSRKGRHQRMMLICGIIISMTKIFTKRKPTSSQSVAPKEDPMVKANSSAVNLEQSAKKKMRMRWLVDSQTKNVMIGNNTVKKVEDVTKILKKMTADPIEMEPEVADKDRNPNENEVALEVVKALEEKTVKERNKPKKKVTVMTIYTKNHHSI